MKITKTRVDRLLKANEQLSILRAEVERMKDSLKADMEAEGITEAFGNHGNVNVKSYSKNNVDTQALKEAGLYESFLKPRLQVSLTTKILKPFK